MTYQAVMFDLDGTLLDTLDDLAASANRVLAARGYAPHPHDAYRWFIGDGSAKLMERALPEVARSPETLSACLQALLDDYSQNWHVATRPYDGMEALLGALVQRGTRLAIVTNKPHQFTGRMVAHFFARVPFGIVLGQQKGIPRKPNPHQALAAAAALNLPPAACLFLGDSAVDMQTARRAGMLPVGAGWGFRPHRELVEAGAARILEHPLDLLGLLDA